MKDKYLVFRTIDGDPTPLWYCGYTTGLRGGTWPEEWNPDKTKATLLTQKQAKRLIDAQRHRMYDCFAEPSFTVVY